MRPSFLLNLIATFSLVSLAVQASPAPSTHEQYDLERRAPTFPEDDPFYQAPKINAKSSSSFRPGTIIRTREVQLATIGFLPLSIKSAHQFLHWTVDLYGKPQANMATLIIPNNQVLTKDGVPRVVVYQVAEDSAWSGCAPSYQFRAGGQGNVLVQEEILTMNHMLAKGWTLVVTDYEGPQSGFTAGDLAATGVLDAFRAALNFNLVVPKAKSHLVPVSLWGYSGGALATGWALQRQPQYAPELSRNIITGIIGGLPVNIRNNLLKHNGGLAAGLVATGIMGQANVRPDLMKYIKANMSPAGLDALRFVNRTCLPQAVVGLAFKDIFKFFNLPQEEVLNAPVVKKALDSGILGQPGTPVSRIPQYLYVAVADEIISGPDVDAYVTQQCARGASITFTREILAGHLTLTLTGAARAFKYLEDRFNGLPTSGCKTDTIASSLTDPDALAQFGDFALSQFKSLFGFTQKGFLGSLLYNLGQL